MRNRITCRIDENLKGQFRTFCEDKDVSCSEMLRRMILMLIGKESEQEFNIERSVGKCTNIQPNVKF
jgi:antitoxin component of RelBE/YafQ-DinJ toxin-antitoxin module